MLRHHPLALPPGSVRAILALGLIGTVCLIAGLGREVPSGLEGLAGAAIAFYFRAREGAPEPTKEAPNE